MTQLGLPSWGRAYIAVVAATGAAILAHSLYDLYAQSIDPNWFILAGLTLITGSATVRLPSVPATISISETFVFTSTLLYGPAAGTVTVALDALVISYSLARRGHPAYRLLFNIFALPASLWVSAHLFFWWSGLPPLSMLTEAPGDIEITNFTFSLILFTACYFALNSWSIAGAIAIERHQSPLGVWRDNFAWLWLNYFGGASVASLLVIYTRDVDFGFLAIVLPLLALLYYTFKTAMGRAEDTNKHLTELNRLYMSTIETLAMAIDAKDQITHGHIRRVQHYAVELAKRVGVRDHAQISAIEAASLLHDMGKLAVPEYILNKPGALTPAEFEKMKLHASVGADILGAIEFPYPVVPIVRHHHENWDGTGYPDGLRGTQIPMGARILSVVDCFDALTSDRPYRPKLPDAEALKILLQRRGKMYDPVVVDTFIAVHTEIAPPSEEPSLEKNGLSAITRNLAKSSNSDTRLDEINASTEETVLLYELTRRLAGSRNFGDTADTIARYLRRVLPTSTVVFFVHDESLDELTAQFASGEHSALFSELTIPRGQRLTGWVAANRLSVLNSDPVLDLGEAARAARPALRSCLSTALLAGTDLLGVITAYSAQRDAFSDNHLRVLEAASGQIGQALRSCLVQEQERRPQRATMPERLPARAELERALGAELDSLGKLSSVAVVNVDIQVTPRGTTDRILNEVIDSIRRDLSLGASLYQTAEHSFVALLPKTDTAAALAVARRVREGLRLLVEKHPSLANAIVGVAAAPHDGVEVQPLLLAAQSQPQTPPSQRKSQSIH
jgi:putative nucleotidyltransferase with HDIG domain